TIPRRLASTLFPYPTLFRSVERPTGGHRPEPRRAGAASHLRRGLRDAHRRLRREVQQRGDPRRPVARNAPRNRDRRLLRLALDLDRKSTRVNSSHVAISYAV